MNRLFFACGQDTAVLTGAMQWLDEMLAQAQERVSRETELPEIYRWQGEARSLRKLKDDLQKKVRVKDGEGNDQRPVRAVR